MQRHKKWQVICGSNSNIVKVLYLQMLFVWSCSSYHTKSSLSVKKNICIVYNTFFMKCIALSIVKDIVKKGEPEGRKLTLGLEDWMLFA